MILKTKFDIDDKVYSIVKQFGKWGIFSVPLTIGKVTKSIIDSPGTEKTIFCNYRPQKGEEESYMCAETGIGTGQIYKAENLFSSKKFAEKRCKELNARIESEAAHG